MNHTQNEKFRGLLGSFSTAVLITYGSRSTLHARPMAIVRVDDNCDLWFVTSRESAKVHEIDLDTRVEVVCQNGWSSCVCIAGHASIEYDRAKIKELWNPSLQIWFPEGPDDPEITLIRVVGEQGEYWDNTGVNRVTYLYQALKAVMTGTIPESRQGEQHGHVIMEH